MANLGALAASERILKLYFPDDDGPECGLLINRLVADESVSRDFHFEVTVLSDASVLDLQSLIGKRICVELLRDNLPGRFFHGHCFAAERLSVDTDLAVHRLSLRPWVYLFRAKRNFRLFHYQSIAGQSKAVFRETGLARHELRIRQADPQRTYSCQYDETDHNYLHRRWEEIGWHYWYEHDLHGHTLVLADTSQAAEPVDGKPELVWRHDDASPDPHKISAWRATRKLVSAAVSQTGFDFKSPSPSGSGERDDTPQGQIHPWEVRQYLGFKVRHHAERELESITVQGRTACAQSGCRTVQPGRHFRLAVAGSPCAEHGEAFFITRVRHIADNNFLNSEGAAAHYENEFECVPLDRPWRPLPGYHSEAVRVDGIDTATVTGIAGQDVYPDQYGRIRVQFHWDREGKNDANSSAWLRLAGRRAGGEFGTLAVARVGQEVLVQYLAGSPDKPIVVGAVVNARNMPPWLLPAQHALAGIRSRELAPGGGNGAAGRSNHLLFDDTAGQIQLQLRSDHRASQLSLGWISRIEDHAGRKEGRGQGYECRTDGWGALRAGKGMLLSTTLHANLEQHAKHISGANARLEKAHGCQKEWTGAAQQAAAQKHNESADARKHVQQATVVHALREQADAIAGMAGKAGQRPEELQVPHILLESPAGIEIAAEQTIAAEALHLAQTAGKNLAWAAGGSLFIAVEESLRAFAKQAGIKLVAAAGNIDASALSKAIHIFAKMTIQQSAGRVEIRAKEEVLIKGGGSYMRLVAGSIERGTSGPYNSHAAKHSFLAPKQMGPGKFIDTKIEPRKPVPVPVKFNLVLTHLPGPQGFPLPDVEWRIVEAGDAVAALHQAKAMFKGKSNKEGKIVLDAGQEKELKEAWDRFPYNIWVVYANQVRHLVLSQEDENWSDQEKLEHALDAMGFTDQLWQTADGDMDETGRLQQAHRSADAADAAALIDKFKKG